MVADADFPSDIEDVSVGDAGPSIEITDLERRDFVRYAGASGDFNPLHYDDSYAREAGHERVFGQGMFTAGIAAQVATRWFGVASVRTFSVRFHQKVFPEETLVCTGEVTDVDNGGETSCIEADIVVVNEQDETVLTGSLTVDVGQEAS